jgi:hypothetical protein
MSGEKRGKGERGKGKGIKKFYLYCSLFSLLTPYPLPFFSTDVASKTYGASSIVSKSTRQYWIFCTSKSFSNYLIYV